MKQSNKSIFINQNKAYDEIGQSLLNSSKKCNMKQVQNSIKFPAIRVNSFCDFTKALSPFRSTKHHEKNLVKINSVKAKKKPVDNEKKLDSFINLLKNPSKVCSLPNLKSRMPQQKKKFVLHFKLINPNIVPLNTYDTYESSIISYLEKYSQQYKN